MSATSRLRTLLAAPGLPLVLPGVPNTLAALVVEQAGFEAAYVSGAGLSNSFLGAPDVGLLTATELTSHVAAIADAVDLPLVVDADTGFGNALNVQRTVRMLERAGAAAIQIEDQVSPKRCGHFAGKDVVPLAEMVGRVQAACDARTDPDLVIVARTDAIASEGFPAALERVAAYQAAGADVLFVEAPQTEQQMADVVRQVPGVHLANMVEGGLTPLRSRAELGEAGFRVALYANTAMRGAVLGMRRVLTHLAATGDTRGAADLMISWDDRQGLVRKSDFDERERRYADQHEKETP